MQLENMESSTDNECMNKFDPSSMSDEFNFCSDVEEQRESGDGDSGGESKESPEPERSSNKDCQTITQASPSNVSPGAECAVRNNDGNISQISSSCRPAVSRTDRDNEDEVCEIVSSQKETPEENNFDAEMPDDDPHSDMPRSMNMSDNCPNGTRDVDEIDSSATNQTPGCVKVSFQEHASILRGDGLPARASFHDDLTPYLESQPASLTDACGILTGSNPNYTNHSSRGNVIPAFCADPNGIPSNNTTPNIKPFCLVGCENAKMLLMPCVTPLHSNVNYTRVCECYDGACDKNCIGIMRDATESTLSGVSGCPDFPLVCVDENESEITDNSTQDIGRVIEAFFSEGHYNAVNTSSNGTIREECCDVAARVGDPLAGSTETADAVSGDLTLPSDVNVDEVRNLLLPCPPYLHAPLTPTDLEEALMEESILEAPEEFRSADDDDRDEEFPAPRLHGQVDTGVPEECRAESAYRDHDNAHEAETGDTTRRTKDKDIAYRGSETRPIRKVNDTVGRSGAVGTASCSENNESPIADNDHVDADRDGGVMTAEHVGSAQPPSSVNNNNNSAGTSVEMNGAKCALTAAIRAPPTSTAPQVTPSSAAATAASAAGGDSEVACAMVRSPVGECATAWDAVNAPGPTSASPTLGACVCAAPPSARTSIEGGVAKCAQAPGCSRVPTASVCAAPDSCPTNTSSCDTSLHPDNRRDNKQHPAALFADNPARKGEVCAERRRYSSPVCQRSDSGGAADDNKKEAHLCWKFKNGRLVFENVTNDVDENESDPGVLGQSSRTRDEQVVVRHKQNGKNCSELLHGCVEDSSEDTDKTRILSSKDLNKRINESKSRLRLLEQKLKEAGIVDGDSSSTTNRYIEYNKRKNVGDVSSPAVNHTSSKSSSSHINSEQHPDQFSVNKNETVNNSHVESDHEQEEDESVYVPSSDNCADYSGSNLCEFDVRQVGSFSGFNGFCEVYDELDDDDVCESRTNGGLIVQEKMRGDGNTMGADGDRASKHNPDKDNLKSLLKKPGKTKDKKGRNVIFNEKKNEFFDADYIILIREECDYDDEDDDGICTCNQHEMVRLQCCEPNCNCNGYEGYDPTPQSPKFAPPLEFVDAVTLSPPEGYKDMELGEQQLLALQQMARRGQRPAVCKECSASHEDDDRVEDEGEASHSDGECENTSASARQPEDLEEQEEKEKTDQSQQTTPTTPPNADSPNSQRYILETITMTTVSEQRIIREVEEERKAPSPSLIPTGSPISGILKGGRLWKQQSLDTNGARLSVEPQQATDSSATSDEEGGMGSSRRSVRFIESEGDKRDSCDGAPDNAVEEDADNKQQPESASDADKQADACNNSVSPESTEMMLTFKLGNHVLISNNSLKPNSAVRQLFPCTKPVAGKSGEEEPIHQYLVTAESLRAFEEAKRSKLPQIIQSGETDESIKRAIERNTLRRSLIRYEPRSKKPAQKTDNSLEERIKQLTCDVDDINQEAEEARVSPTGEEARQSPDPAQLCHKPPDKSFSPSSSSTASSSSSSMSSTYKKLTDLFSKREKTPDNINEAARLPPGLLPDLGNGPNPQDFDTHPHIKATNESRRQFLSTLAPLTACVSGVGGPEEFYHISNHIGERTSMASSVGTEYSLEDIDEGLKNAEEEAKRITPDVLAGTPSASESGDELAMFVQQDASRIERIKKKYQPEPNKDEDDEHDDYGFNKRPSVRGIKPRFSTTTEILQQIQNQLQPPGQNVRVAWPYYSESGLTTTVDNTKTKNINQNMPNYHYPPSVPEDVKPRNAPPQYRPTSLQDESIYQNCTSQRCVREIYRTNVNHTYSSVVRIGAGCNEYYQSLPRTRNGRPQSPPPLELSKNYHQTMVYIPYNHIEGCHPAMSSPSPYYHASEYSRVNNQNQINKRYIEPIYQQRIHPAHSDEQHYTPGMLPPMPHKPIMRPQFPAGQQQHLVSSRSESPLPGQFSTARSTQTPAVTLATCYYPNTTRYRPVVGPVWQGEGNYVTKLNRHSFPAGGPRYANPDNISLTDSESPHCVPVPNGYRQSVEITFSTQKDSIPNSPTKPRFIERGVPEGAASVSPQDSMSASQNTSTMTSPTSPQNPAPPNTQKPLFYAMNV